MMKQTMRYIGVQRFLSIIVSSIFFLAACTPANPFLLSEPGQYQFGTHQYYDFKDASRDDRDIKISVWYPAVLPEGSPPSDYNFDAEPDSSGAPYPLILSSAKVGSVFGPHLATHGFVVVGVSPMDYYDPWDKRLIDYPLDILAALNHVASTPLKGLEGMIDAEHAGAMGYSFDGYNALALSGARVDPDYYLARCANAPTMKPAFTERWIKYYCTVAGEWDKFTLHAGDSVTISDDGLWQPMTDERIRAVMPMAPEGAWLFGERGLKAVNRPTLIIGATEDTECFYDSEAAYIFDHLGLTERYLISFIGQDHYMIFQDDQASIMKHFATAFFGYYLQGKAEYADYFSEKFVSKREGLAWGIYENE